MPLSENPEARQRSLANLRPYRPGESGTSRPGSQKPKSLPAFVRDNLKARDWVEALMLIAWGTPDQRKEFFHEVVTPSAKDRLVALQMLADRGWGQNPQAVAVTGPDGAVPRLVMIEVLPQAGLGVVEPVRSLSAGSPDDGEPDAFEAELVDDTGRNLAGEERPQAPEPAGEGAEPSR